MNLYNNKKIILLCSISAVCAMNLSADEFNWSTYKKTLPSSIIEQNDLSTKEMTREQIKKQHDVDVERRTLSEIKRDQTSKNLTVSAMFRNSQTFYTGGTPAIPGVSAGTPAVANNTSQFGISVVGRFDLMPIGKKFNNTYAHIDVFEDSIFMGFSRRIQAENRKGLFSDIGGGLFFQTQETVRKKDMFMYGFIRVGYNFDDWNIKVGTNIPSDAFDKGFFNTTQYNVSIGWRF